MNCEFWTWILIKYQFYVFKGFLINALIEISLNAIRIVSHVILVLKIICQRNELDCECLERSFFQCLAIWKTYLWTDGKVSYCVYSLMFRQKTFGLIYTDGKFVKPKPLIDITMVDNQFLCLKLHFTTRWMYKQFS